MIRFKNLIMDVKGDDFLADIEFRNGIYKSYVEHMKEC